MEGRPIQMRAGKVTSVPPPATELMAPARNAAPNATISRVNSAETRSGAERFHAAVRRGRRLGTVIVIRRPMIFVVRHLPALEALERFVVRAAFGSDDGPVADDLVALFHFV